jgi:hypothetical protein
MDRDQIPWFRVRSASDIERLPNWLKRQAGTNTCNPRTDKNGNPIILFGWDERPDSDWGRFRGHRFALWFADAAIAEAAEPVWRKALGWAEASAPLFQGEG